MTLSKAGSMQTWLAARYFLLDRSDDFQQQFTRAKERFDAEAIHDLRVSSRRFRECLAIFADCFRKRRLAPIRTELKNLTAMLGTIRNTDEAILFFSPLSEQCSSGPASAAADIVATLQEKRAAEQKNLKRELIRFDSGSLLRSIAGLRCNPHLFTPAAETLFQPVATYILEAVSTREKTMLELLPEALREENVTAQHRLRVAVKRFRYRVELLAPFASSDYKGVYSIIKGYQEALGHMHDLDVFKEMLAGFPSEAQTAAPLETVIIERRKIFFAEFLRMQSADPLDKTGDLVRGLL